MGRGSSKAGGRSAGGGTASKKDQDAFVERIARGMANPSPDETPMSNGDVQGIVEAYAIEHGLSAQDEDRLVDAIRDRANEIERKMPGAQSGTKKIDTRDLASVFNENKETQNAAQGLYDIQRTMAFPSTDSVVKRVPELAEMKQKMADAPVGTTVVGSFIRNGAPGVVETRVMEKTSSTTWSMRDMIPDTGGNGVHNAYAPGSYRGIKALQMMQHVLSDGYRDDVVYGAAQSYKKLKKK